MRNVLLKIINAKVSVPSYLIAISSFVLATYALVKLSDLIVTPLADNILIGIYPWVLLLVVGNGAVLIGMFAQTRWLIRWGSFLSFCMWIFGGIGFVATHQGLTTTVVIVPYLIEYAYLYVCASLGLFDGPPAPVREGTGKHRSKIDAAA